MFNSNFYNPYMQSYALGNAFKRGSLFGTGKNLFSKFSFSGFLNGASKTLNVVNQAIPIFYQVKPMINNCKTMFKIIGAVNDNDTSTKNNISNNDSINKNIATNKITSNDTVNDNNPVFFI